MTDADALRRAYVRVAALRTALTSESGLVDQRFAEEFHAALDQVESTGIKLQEFRLPEGSVARRVYSTSYMRNAQPQYSERASVDRAFLLMKVDAVLGYFTLAGEQAPREIGFRQP